MEYIVYFQEVVVLKIRYLINIVLQTNNMNYNFNLDKCCYSKPKYMIKQQFSMFTLLIKLEKRSRFRKVTAEQ